MIIHFFYGNSKFSIQIVSGKSVVVVKSQRTVQLVGRFELVLQESESTGWFYHFLKIDSFFLVFVMLSQSLADD